MSELDYVIISPIIYDRMLEFGGEEHTDEEGQEYMTHPWSSSKYIKSEPFETRNVDNS